LTPHRVVVVVVQAGNGKTKRLVLEMLGIEEGEWEWAASKMGVDYHLPSQLDPDEAALFLARALPPLFANVVPRRGDGVCPIPFAPCMHGECVCVGSHFTPARDCGT
jgi:hypothetical protein